MIGATELVLLMQVASAAVVGTVRDRHTGELLAGALVTLSDIDRTALTDEFGRYSFEGVLPGPQHLSVQLLSYETRTLHALVAAQGQLEINLSLRPNPIPLGPVSVAPMVPVRGVEGDSDASFPDRSISIAAVRNHPLLSESDAFEALGGGFVTLQPETPSGIHIRGGASDQTSYYLDGIPVFSPYHAAGMFSAWNPDALSSLLISSSSATAESLSGSVGATTRTPGTSLRGQGSLSTTQARMTVDGPLGFAGVGYLLSLRSGFAGGVTSPREAARLQGETGDGLVKIGASLFGGDLGFLAYWSENELDAVAKTVPVDPGAVPPARNAFDWQSNSVGADWRRAVPGAELTIRGWRATGGAHADWLLADPASQRMDSQRRDEGFQATVERSGRSTATTVGARLQRSRTTYALIGGAEETSNDIAATTPTASIFVDHRRAVTSDLGVEVGISMTGANGGAYPSPRLELAWGASSTLRLSASASRFHQFAQSLRNNESVVGNVFPVDLYVGSGAEEVPVARSDQAVVAAEYRPLPGLRLEAQLFARDFEGLVLVAPTTGEPFAVDGFASGRGSASGLSLDAGYSGARVGIVGSYGWQRVRLEAGSIEYVPSRSASHVAQAGLIFFPGATSSIRVGATSAFGRRTTSVLGGLEWEPCNLLDLGCEFGGSPRHDPGALGASALPPYVRLDIGVRKHWHVQAASRDGLLGVFGTLTNVLERTNLLTLATDPLTGELDPIAMRSFSPLVVGVDWRF